MARMTRIMRSSLDYYARSELDEHLSGEVWGRRYDGTSARLEDPNEGVGVLREELSEASGVRRRIAVLDLTFAAPKSVSVRWALGDATEAAQIETAHRESVARSLWYLRATDLRKLDHRGDPHGVIGLSYVAFTHRLSRDGDPHLHDHVVVMNAARFEDLGLRTLDLARLTRVLPMLEVVYRAELQRSLRRELGIELVGRQLGPLQIMGQSEALNATFSTRRETIMGASARFQSTARARQVAALATRPEKGTWSLEERRSRWRAMAEGISPTRVDRTKGAPYFRGEDLRAAGGVYMSPTPGHLHSEVGYRLLCDQERPVIEVVEAVSSSFGLTIVSEGGPQGLLAIRADQQARAREVTLPLEGAIQRRVLGRSEREERLLAARGMGVPYEGAVSGRVWLEVPAPERLAGSQIEQLVHARRIEGIGRISDLAAPGSTTDLQPSPLTIRLDPTREVSVFPSGQSQHEYLVVRLRSYLQDHDPSVALDLVVHGASRAWIAALHQSVFEGAQVVECTGKGRFALGEPVRITHAEGDTSGLVVGGGGKELLIKDREGVESSWALRDVLGIERTLIRHGRERAKYEWGIVEVATPSRSEFTTTMRYLELSDPLLRRDRLEELARADLAHLSPHGVIWARVMRTRTGVDRVLEHARSMDAQEAGVQLTGCGEDVRSYAVRPKRWIRDGIERGR